MNHRHQAVSGTHARSHAPALLTFHESGETLDCIYDAYGAQMLQSYSSSIVWNTYFGERIISRTLPMMQISATL